MADDEVTLWSLLGSKDNLSEPVPIWNKKTTMVAMTASFISVSWICVLLRLYARIRVTRNQGWDDALVFVLQLFGTAGALCICLASAKGFGEHFLLIGVTRAQACIRLFYIANATYALQTALIKISILLQYLRMLRPGGNIVKGGNGGRLRIWCLGLVAVSTVWGAIYSVMAWAPCVPVHGYWNWELVLTGRARCWGFGSQNPVAFDAAFASHNATNMLLDALVLITSIPLHFFQNTGTQSKKALCALTVLGSLVLFIAIWRFASVVEHRSATYPTFDPTWYGASSMLLGMVEINLASICACLPVFWPVFTTKLDSIQVTHEVEVTREERWSYCRGNAIQLQDTDAYKSHFQSTRPKVYFDPGGDASRE